MGTAQTHGGGADDPFKKVKNMIKDLIVRVMEEANKEAEHKGWCGTELSTNEQPAVNIQVFEGEPPTTKDSQPY